MVGFINQVRMERAREKIEEQKLPLQEIAYEVGIQNYNYFYLLFKKLTGCLPQNMGRRNRKKYYPRTSLPDVIK